MRLDFERLKKVQEFYGSDDFEVGSGGDVMKRGDFKYVEPYMTLRFGYWMGVNISKLKEILPKSWKVEEEGDWDDDCGYKCYYIIKQ